MSDMSLFDHINSDIQKHKATAMCGTAISINPSVYNMLVMNHSTLEVNRLFKGVDVFLDKDVLSWKLENWEWT